jgi:uncharacterized protein
VKQTPSDERMHLKFSAEEVAAFVAKVKEMAPEER